MYLGITQGFAEWILPKPNLLNALHDSLRSLPDNIDEDSIFTEGPVRIYFSRKNNTVFAWNVDYVSSTGDESIGLVKIYGEYSIFNHTEFSRESLERSFYLINQRLQGLLIEGAFIHKKYEGNMHTLLAGRGSTARNYSLAYFDTVLKSVSGSRAIIIVGPHNIYEPLIDFLSIKKAKIDDLSKEMRDKMIKVQYSKILEDDMFTNLRKEIRIYTINETPETSGISGSQIEIENRSNGGSQSYRSSGYSFSDWIKKSSSLSDEQRRVIESDVISRHPIRIIGPGGSGKTLLMQLMASKKLLELLEDPKGKIIYIVHNEAMRAKIIQNFQILLPDLNILDLEDKLVVTTLSEYCREALQLKIDTLLDRDASAAREFQYDQILEILGNFRSEKEDQISQSNALKAAYSSSYALEVFAQLVLTEISIAIKGNGLENDKERYIRSERSLSNLHGTLGELERGFIYDVFEIYHNTIFHGYGVLDPDDLAITLYGSLKTPLWKLKRQEEGYDYIFVDEAQLFSENERKIFALLSRFANRDISIALALDEAQALYGVSTAGYSTLGIKNISNQMLESIHRSSVDILKLAFFVLQRSTNLFSVDFPDFTKNEFNVTQGDANKIVKPRIEIEGSESPSFSKFVLRKIRDLRKSDMRQIALICHDEKYWSQFEKDLMAAELPFQVLRERGEKIRSDQPNVVLCRPAQVGGQEFEAVIITGLENTNVNNENVALQSALEQQMIREIYLSVTRAKYQVIFAVPKNSKEHEILQQAVSAGLIQRKTT